MGIGVRTQGHMYRPVQPTVGLLVEVSPVTGTTAFSSHWHAVASSERSLPLKLGQFSQLPPNRNILAGQSEEGKRDVELLHCC